MGQRRAAIATPLLLTALLAPAAVAAQTPAPPRLELGARGGGLVVVGADGGFGIGWGPHVSLRATRFWGIDLAADALLPSESGSLYGFYQVILSRVAREDGASARLLVNFGVAGAFQVEREPERRIERPDGSAVIYHRHTRVMLAHPVLLVFGVGFHRPVARHAALRSDVQVLVGGYRGALLQAMAGVSVPIGGAYAR